MPLYPRTLSHSEGGLSLRTLPNPAVNAALTAGLFSLQPAIRIYTPYDQVSSYALKRLGILVVAGGIIKVTLSNYSDIVILKTPLDHDPVASKGAGGFVVVGRGSGSASRYMKHDGVGVGFAVGEVLGNASGEYSRCDINNALFNISPGIRLGNFGPFLDISAGVMVHGVQDVTDTPLPGVLPRGLTRISRERSISLNFAEIVTQGKCLEGSAADVSTIQDVFAYGVVSLSLRELPSALSVTVFARPTSPFIYYRNNIIEVNTTLYSHGLFIGDNNLEASIQDSVILGTNTTPESHALFIGGGNNSSETSIQDSVIDLRISLVFLGLIALIGLSLRPRRVAVEPLVLPVLIRRHIPKGSIPRWFLLEEEKLNTREGLVHYLDDCTCDQYVEVWYNKKNMASVNKFVANGCQFLPAQSPKKSGAFGYLVMDLLLYIMESFEFLMASVWLAHKYMGQEYLLRTFMIVAVLVLPAGAVRYFRSKLYLRPFVKLKGRKRRWRGRMKTGVWESFETRPEGVHIPRVSVAGSGSLGRSSTGKRNGGVGNSSLN
ncbi:hypothetical protein CVT25_014560 [Psilocybe cyanescens]|uniref:Uncharacterized protein n=1 Tax=Psilocybe cyanescens TaxID=93625 RepID=A0A409WRG4_PSICY|nr:hypothetical protein CVT25_014560 [Psilocybe cyanescens]